MWLRLTLMRIRIRIRLITLMRIRILIMIWCGSGCRFGFDFSPWCGSGSRSRSQLPNKGSDPWKSAKIGSYSIHSGLSSANWCGSGSGSGSSLSLWCGSECGSGFIFDADADPDADPGYQNDTDPQHWYNDWKNTGFHGSTEYKWVFLLPQMPACRCRARTWCSRGPTRPTWCCRPGPHTTLQNGAVVKSKIRDRV